MAGDTEIILTELKHITSNVDELRKNTERGQEAIIGQLKELNGTVRDNQRRITVLECTALRISAIKMSAIVAGVIITVLVLSEVVKGLL